MELFPQIKGFVRSRYFFLRERIAPSKIDNAKDIPIIINNFNRLDTLKLLIDSLTSRGLRNIYILDNMSSYPPLLEYYKSIPFEVIHLGANLGFKALWKHKQTRKRFCGDYYIYTDPDVVFGQDCPENVVETMFSLLKDRYKYAFKIGPSLRIDNLPDCYDQKSAVIEWEQRFFENKNSDNLYRAPIDTTFALYRPRIGLSRRRSLESYRMAAPYQMLHLPWYNDSSSLSDEEVYYRSQCKSVTAWSSK